MKVIVAGAGPGAADLYTDKMIQAVRSADLVLTAGRLYDSLSALTDKVQVMGVMDTVSYINAHRKESMTICVAASGDTGFYSIASTIAKNVRPEIEMEFISGIGSLSYFMAKLKLGYEDVKTVSLHGRNKSIVPYVCYHEKVFALTGGTLKVQDIAKQLRKAGLSNVTMYIGENLSLEEERILTGNPADFAEMEFDDLSVLVVENKNYANRHKTLKDEDFVRGKSPMTKEAVRNLVLSALEIEPTDIVYDIGAGTGSVTCAMAYKAYESTVYAVEKNSEGVELVKQNMAATGAGNIVIRNALAPDGLSDFPPADKVFIGGSTGNLREIMEVVLAKNPTAVFAVTAVTLETISQATEVFKELQMATEVVCANIATAKKLGNYHLMQADNPVYIIKGARKLEN
ncbi:MAG: precorrin-6y C5,15-methyltransferase (decarboxylating) subunit CbiE [Emergencia sp.]|jgi:precorrin-6Y C5,15-methyltransferase (decarboxylating)|nr:precorrin-6y C5,15-methyltransferase (decarboxylating) subunit CbiE [Emergencia sp.]